MKTFVIHTYQHVFELEGDIIDSEDGTFRVLRVEVDPERPGRKTFHTVGMFPRSDVFAIYNKEHLK